MDLELRDKVALVTGASRGLGLAIARTLVREGCRVAVNGRDALRAEAAAREIGERAWAAPGDVTNPEACRSLVRAVEQRGGRLDVLVCNVGGGASVPPGQETPGEWARVFQLNLSAATNIVEAAQEALGRFKGVIVCISSICGIEALGAPVTYSAAKAALNAYVRGISRPLAGRGVRINAVAPGNLLFEGSVWERKLSEDAEAVQAMVSREVALRRLGRPEEVAEVVAFLASSRSSFSTGSVVVVDGGQVRS